MEGSAREAAQSGTKEHDVEDNEDHDEDTDAVPDDQTSKLIGDEGLHSSL